MTRDLKSLGSVFRGVYLGVQLTAMSNIRCSMALWWGMSDPQVDLGDRQDDDTDNPLQ